LNRPPPKAKRPEPLRQNGLARNTRHLESGAIAPTEGAACRLDVRARRNLSGKRTEGQAMDSLALFYCAQWTVFAGARLYLMGAAMKVIVLGAGVIGTASTWYLAKAGHEVTVIDRQPGAGLETSYANGGQISVSHAEPWANPQAPIKVLKWLMREDAPLLFRLRADPAQWEWGLRFLAECTPGRARDNTVQILSMASYARRELQALRAETAIQYDQLMRGILHVYTEQKEFDAAIDAAALMREYDCDRQLKTPEECFAIEPALRNSAVPLVGATYTAHDESGDAFKFTHNLAQLCMARGVQFRYGSVIRNLQVEGGRIAGVMLGEGQTQEMVTADAYVMAMGSYSPLILRRAGISVPIYPAKGYSITIQTAGYNGAPTVSITDDGAKLVFSRLGDRLRVAGTAELNGYNTDLNTVRCGAIVKRTFELFPQAGDRSYIQYWTGLRPATPSNVPYVGWTRYPNLFLNTGHGTLGWTMSCGSGRAIADIVSGNKPALDFRFCKA
jgi:D-amino-acid dehydrogenase